MALRLRARTSLVVGLAAVLLLGLASSSPAARRTGARGNPYALVNGCFGLRSAATGRLVARAGTGYAASARRLRGAYRLRMQAAALGRYLLLGSDRALVGVDSGGGVSAASTPADSTVWRVTGARGGSFVLTSVSSGRTLSVARGGRLILTAGRGAAGASSRFTFRRTRGCAAITEAGVNAAGRPFRGASPEATVQGVIDAHTHLTAFDFIGGDFHCGAPWHPFGVTFALPDCASIQGPKGSAAPVQNFLDFGEPVHPHDTVGWPTFRDWPGPTRLSYEGSYYTGLKRAWLGGLRLMVTDLVDNEALCSVMTMRRNPCNDMASVHIQARDLRALQDYIDAQSGGPGKGWFRIVANPFQARRVINQGKLAVVEGIEVSRIFGCGEHSGVSECSPQQVDQGMAEVRRLGVSSFYPVHKFDNAFGGTKMDGGNVGAIINGGNHLETGQFWDVRTCTGPEHDSQQLTPATGGVPSLAGGPFASMLPGGTLPVYGPAPHCNARGLTSLGGYLLKRMMDQHFLIEIDHMDAKTGDQALNLIEQRHYSGVVSPHNWSSPEQYPRIYRTGGFITPIAGTSPEAFVSQWRADKAVRSPRYRFGFGYGSDMNGLADQSSPTNRHPVSYPFRSLTGQVTFGRERWGDRVFDLNTDGVANYGMYADWLQELRVLGGQPLANDMLDGAEAYLQTWERSYGVPPTRCRPAGERFTSAGLGRALRLGASTRASLYRAGQPSSRTGRSFAYCAAGGGRVLAVFGAGGRLGLIASTSRGASAAGIRLGASARALRGRTVSAGRGVLISRARAGAARFVYGVRGGKVQWVAVAAGSESRSASRLRGDLRAAGI